MSNLNLVSKEKKGPNNHYKRDDEAEVLSVCSSLALPFSCAGIFTVMNFFDAQLCVSLVELPQLSH